ncbi:MAG: pilus assembly protein [Myxococcota bacterium]|nr:pilus assembly protein [Myxococcota bacterium]MDW8361070.1 TadE/TadG family type IV pilus assembly protein [Myxococcales bacterium]
MTPPTASRPTRGTQQAEHAGGLTLRQDARGAAYVEFLIAFIPLFVMFLGMLQAAMMYAAQLVVQHAANRAARAAVVVLPDDPARYDGDPVNQIEMRGGGGGGRLSIPGIGALSLSGQGNARVNAIRAAASIPLLAVSPSFDQLYRDAQVVHALSGGALERGGAGILLYNRFAVGVTFPREAGSDEVHTSHTFGPDDDVTVRVTYLFHCGVPIASRFMCDTFLDHLVGTSLAAAEDMVVAARDGDLQALLAAHRRFRHARDRIQAADAGWREIQLGADSPGLGIAVHVTGARYAVLRAEATLRNHGARYEY